jgi:hypothetical protein
MSHLAVVREETQPFRVDGLGYVYDPPGAVVRLHADFVARHSDEFSAEILADRSDSGKILHVARVNLVSTQGRRNFVTYLKEVCKDDKRLDLPWAEYLEQFCHAVVKSERSGSPFYRAVELSPKLRPSDLITRLLPGAGPTMWFAPQGSGKGWVAMIACAAIASGRSFAGLAARRAIPLYLDWEDSPDVWHERLVAVATGLGLDDLPDVRYRQCRQRMRVDLPSILRYVQQEHIGVIVVDSVGPAMGGNDGLRWDEQTLGFFEGLRYLSPLPILLIDHMSGETAGNGPQREDKAFGSIYKMAEVRAAWAIRKDQDTDADEQVLAFYHRKHNHTRKFPAIGVKLNFESDAQGVAALVAATPADVRDNVILARGLSQGEQFLAYLRREGRATLEVIAEAIGIPPNQARSIGARLKKGGKAQHFEDGSWGLSATPWGLN